MALCGTGWNATTADLRSASRGSAKPAPMTPGHANVGSAPLPTRMAPPPTPAPLRLFRTAGCASQPDHGGFSPWWFSLPGAVRGIGDRAGQSAEGCAGRSLNSNSCWQHQHGPGRCEVMLQVKQK